MYKHVVVLDLEGLSAGVLRRENRELLGRAARQLQRCYPESMHRILLVNPPRLFATGWKLLQPLIDSISYEKIVIVGTAKDEKSRAVLLEAGVDAAYLERAAPHAPC